jgi:hypothetical protein
MSLFSGKVKPLIDGGWSYPLEIEKNTSDIRWYLVAIKIMKWLAKKKSLTAG